MPKPEIRSEVENGGRASGLGEGGAGGGFYDPDEPKDDVESVETYAQHMVEPLFEH
jgi:hypothetical protein